MTCHKTEKNGPRRCKRGASRPAPPSPAAAATGRWDREQIQHARKTSLAPLLRRRGYLCRAELRMYERV
jgi:hypothetical protein